MSSSSDVVSMIPTLQSEDERFRVRFIKVAASVIGLLSLTVGPLAFLNPNPWPTALACLGGLTNVTTAFVLAHRGRHRAGAAVFLYGTQAALTFGSLASVGQSNGNSNSYALLASVLVVLAGFMVGARHAVIMGIISAAIAPTLAWLTPDLRDLPLPQFATNILIILTVLGLTTFSTAIFVGRAERHQRALAARLGEIEAVANLARRIAAGDLTLAVEGDSDISEVIRSMVESLRGIVVEIRSTVSAFVAATSEIAAMARQQEQGAVQQASAVTEVRQTLDSLLQASVTIAGSSQEVLQTVEKTHQANQTIAERLGALTSHTQRIGEILEVIKDIANKSDVLALNASLEGAKAGEAGRGFSLVAGQMQRLAESVMQSVTDVRRLTGDIRDATGATVASAELGTKLAAAVTGATREIALITQQQRSSTEQVTRAMDDLNEVARQISVGCTQTLTATQDLASQSERLGLVVAEFQV